MGYPSRDCRLSKTVWIIRFTYYEDERRRSYPSIFLAQKSPGKQLPIGGQATGMRTNPSRDCRLNKTLWIISFKYTYYDARCQSLFRTPMKHSRGVDVSLIDGPFCLYVRTVPLSVHCRYGRLRVRPGYVRRLSTENIFNSRFFRR